CTSSGRSRHSCSLATEHFTGSGWSTGSVSERAAPAGLGPGPAQTRHLAERSLRSTHMGQLDGKVAIVTGASRGIGAEIARRLAAEGAAVVVTARTRDEGASPLPGTLPETVSRITAAGGTAIAVPADLSRPPDRERLVASAVAELGPIDILVNNAAVT